MKELSRVKRIGFAALVSCLIAMIEPGCAGLSQAQSGAYTPQPGDLLFQDLDSGPLCVAIEKVTQGVDGAQFSHVGMVSEAGENGTLVIEAVSEGVVETPLEEFLQRSADSEGRPKVLVGRLKPGYRPLIPKAVVTARSFLGRPYDRVFAMENESFYCSELIYEAFRQAAGEPLFALAPMTFIDPDTGATFPAWQDYYRELGAPIPEGEPGLNPAGMSRAPVLRIVHAYGEPDRREKAAESRNTKRRTMQLTAMTFNIRYGTAPDGPDAWDFRKEAVAKVVRECRPDVMGVQEALAFQLEYLADELPEYAWFGTDRDATGKGEHTAVYYRRDRVEFIDGGTFWLSETPEVPASKSWGSHHNRTATWLRLRHRDSGREFVVCNTHLDNGSAEARLGGARLIVARAREQWAGLPLLVMGDFNSQGEHSEVWQALTESLRDTRLSAKEVAGPESTFTGFEPKEERPNRRIDWILASPEWRAKSCRTVTLQPHGRPPSDHRPVLAELELE
jgi:endonuclease/exonuclease/phosphatase family metal-dependent hydrolase